MAQRMCCAYRLRARVILAFAAAFLHLTPCCCCCCCCRCCCCCCLCTRFSSNTWRFALFFGGLCPRHVPMTPTGARDLFFCISPTPGFLNSLPPGLFNSLDWTPGLLFNSSDWAPGLLRLLLGVSFSGAPGRGALDADCCTSEQVRCFVGVFSDTS